MPRTRVIQAFLRQLFEDEEAGDLRTLEEYQARFPGCEDDVARGFRAALGEAPSLETFTERSPRRILELGRSLGPFKIVRELGRGGQGAVYLAEDPRLGRNVAIKIVGSLLSDEAQARLRREAAVISRLNHPGICGIHELETYDGIPCIVMPYVAGETLAAWVARNKTSEPDSASLTTAPLGAPEPAPKEPSRPRPAPQTESRVPRTLPEIERVLRWIESVARALHVAHEAGIVHRDIKPGNIMVRPDGSAIILDFGLAQDTESEASALTLTGQFLGTLPYMAPEQLRLGRFALDARVDVYALGVSLYECLTLERPFDEGTQERTYHAILTREPVNPRALNPSINRDLSVVIETALAKERRHRYRTALDLADEIARVRRFEPIRARSLGHLARTLRWSRRNPVLAGTLVALFLALTAGLLVSLVLLAETRQAVSERTRALSEAEAERDRRALTLARLRLRDLPREVERLWPALPKTVSKPLGIDAWLAEARRLRFDLSRYEQARETLRLRADPISLARAKEHLRIADKRREVERFQRRLVARGPDGKAARWLLLAEQRLEELDSQLRDLETPPFRDPEDVEAWDALSELIHDTPKLDPLVDRLEARRSFALSIERRSIDEVLSAWALASHAVEIDPRFPNLRLTPRIGLVPLGPDPRTGLQEFAHLVTGEVPKRRPSDGLLEIGESTGLVFILVPGGTFRMGSVLGTTAGSRDDYQDPDHFEWEHPLHEVTLEPFLLSKFEMTQGQWLRLVGENPAGNMAGEMIGGRMITERNPVEQVSWDDCNRWLPRAGLSLPTEAQWEYAARAGTKTPYWTGATKETLEGAANVADAHAKSVRGRATWIFELWNDGHFVHAPVGTYRENPFGFHDMPGNVMEWCQDFFAPYSQPTRSGDGLRQGPTDLYRIARSGAFSSPAQNQRSAQRSRFLADYRYVGLGVRPACPLKP